MSLFDKRRRRLATEVARILTDGRPPGCTCRPDPFVPLGEALPCDNRHRGDAHCPYTKVAERAAR